MTGSLIISPIHARHFSREAFATRSSSEPAPSIDLNPSVGARGAVTAGGLDTSGSSAFSSPNRAREIAANGDDGSTIKGGSNEAAMLSRFVRCEKPEHLTDRRRRAFIQRPRPGAFQNMPGSETIPPYTVPDARADSRERPAPGSAVNLIPLRRSCWLRASDWKTVSRGGLASPRTDSPVMGNMSSCGTANDGRLGETPKPNTRGQTGSCASQRPKPEPCQPEGISEKRRAKSGRKPSLSSPQEHPWSPDSDPPPMCDEENPTFGNNPNNPQALT